MSASVHRNDPATSASYLSIAEEIETQLRALIASWFPRCVDTEHGGFHQDFAADWTRKPGSNRLCIHQARQTWATARMSLHLPELRRELATYALHGLAYLSGPLADDAHGGLFFSVTPDGRAESSWGSEKHASAIAFAMFAAATTYRATGEARALDFAMSLFRWLDDHAYDARWGGYFDALAPDGTPLLAPGRGGKHDAIGTPYGYKSTNSLVHVLEALTELYVIAPEPSIRVRLEETLVLMRERLTLPPGTLGVFFSPQWHPVLMHGSFGHDVETAYLMLEAAGALGSDDGTSAVARAIVDHTLDWGWDKKHGGVYFAGEALAPACNRSKWWWVQAEALNAFLHLHERYGAESDRYWKAFVMQFDFILDHVIDRRYGGWHACVGEDGEAVTPSDKAMPWKATYHDGRALVNASVLLRRMAE